MLVSEISSRVDADAPEAYFASENVVGPAVAECWNERMKRAHLSGRV